MKIQKVATDIKTVNKYIKAYKTLFDKEPVVLIKGTFTNEYDDYNSNYEEVYKITQKSIYFNVSEERKAVPLYFYDNEYYHVILKDIND